MLLEHSLNVGLEITLRTAVHVEHPGGDGIDRKRHGGQEGHPDGVGRRVGRHLDSAPDLVPGSLDGSVSCR